MPSKKYIEQSINLIKAIDIAIDVIKTTPPKGFDEHQVSFVLGAYNLFKKQVNDANPKFQTMASLKYSIQDVFTYFQEASGETVNEFWNRIYEQGLPYERENRIEKLLKRGKIKNRIEYDFVVDTLVPLKQEGAICEADFKFLNQLISDYEAQMKNNQRRISQSN